jgi:valyl-tRNA synthetase
MDTRFDFKTEEPKIYAEWEKNGHFQPVKDAKNTFSIVLPPPNANADLHLGHAMYVIEDIMIRYHRMKDDSTLWLPGADHAGFETQFVFEKNLTKQGKSRFDYESREKLFSDIWDFVQKNRTVMENQLRRLGFSLDWSRKKFTLDERIQKIVYQTFKKMHDDGLIYRGERLVNYCTKDGTSFSDLEVKHEEIEGKLYFIKYKITGTDEFIKVATTRPETLFGDIAVAVNPKDARYQKYIGKKQLELPLAIEIDQPRLIDIIADEYAKMDFGTGAVKITPSHDMNDYEVWNRNKDNYHLRDKITIIGQNGKLNENVPQEFQGLRVFEVNEIIDAREKVLTKLQEQGLYDPSETKSHKMVVGKCYKCGRVLEPLPIPQWFIKIDNLKQPAIKAIESGNIKFYPESQKERALEWLNNFHDWNISRQVVWGMQIPAWFCVDCFNGNKVENWMITNGEKPEKCSKCGSTKLIQDSDTFDTWFSSGQWPFATLLSEQSNNQTIEQSQKNTHTESSTVQQFNSSTSSDYSRFYPNSVMETGYDILPWWVCRMIMLGIYATGKIPFKNIYLHGLVRDAKGQKMSKSKGNVVNPLEMVDKYGADALRASLLFGIGQGADVPFSEDKVRAMRNFVTKIWNIGRFISESINKINTDLPFYEAGIDQKNPNDKEILTKLERLIQNTSESLENYDFSRGLGLIYDFLWHELADIYIEKIKSRIENKEQTPLIIARHVFLNCLALLHPFMPFVTESLWTQFKHEDNQMLIISNWPKTSK